jgi:hypothetical protein
MGAAYSDDLLPRPDFFAADEKRNASPFAAALRWWTGDAKKSGRQVISPRGRFEMLFSARRLAQTHALTGKQTAQSH